MNKLLSIIIYYLCATLPFTCSFISLFIGGEIATRGWGSRPYSGVDLFDAKSALLMFAEGVFNMLDWGFTFITGAFIGCFVGLIIGCILQSLLRTYYPILRPVYKVCVIV